MSEQIISHLKLSWKILGRKKNRDILTKNGQLIGVKSYGNNSYIYIYIYIYIYVYIYIYFCIKMLSTLTIYTTYIYIYIYFGALSTLVTSVVLYLLTRATLMSPGKDESRACGYIYIYIYIFLYSWLCHTI